MGKVTGRLPHTPDYLVGAGYRRSSYLSLKGNDKYGALATMSEDPEVVALISEERAKQDCTMLGDVWEALSKATVDMKGRGVDVPPDIYNALRGAKNLITLCKGHPKLEDLTPRDIDEHEGFCVACCGADITARIKCELRNIEDLLVLKATNELGTDYAFKLQEKTGEAWKPLQAVVP